MQRTGDFKDVSSDDGQYKLEVTYNKRRIENDKSLRKETESGKSQTNIIHYLNRINLT